jgi:cell division protein FtsB
MDMENLFYRKDRKGFDFRSFLKKLIRNRRAVLGMVAGTTLVLFLLFSSHGVVQRVKLLNEKAELELKIQESEKETRKLQAESKALDGDKKAIEKVAREKHGMVREGETVYKVKKNK